MDVKRVGTTIRNRIAMDFFLAPRFDVYDRLLATAVGHGYTCETIAETWERIKSGTLAPRTFVLRNDVDTDPRTARALWEIDRRHGVRATYYFRLRTLDLDLMREMDAVGTEASYHYEEVATVAKRRGLRSRADVDANMAEIQDLFASNLADLRNRTGLAMRTVASHGDFANRAIKTANHALLADTAFRDRVGVDLETYDEAFTSHITMRAADLGSPQLFAPSDPIDALRAGSAFVYVLVHPRQWQVDRLGNLAEDVLRAREGLVFSARQRRYSGVGPAA